MEEVVRSTVPARMDRLPWSAFHWKMIIALGITWVLDGIEAGLGSQIGDVLRDKQTLHLSAELVGLSAWIYLGGEVVGALYFGRQADKLGRRRLFIVTLALYLFANVLTSLSFSTWFFLATRFIAGMGIGGEYAAIHSAIDELTPAKYRGRVDLAIAGTYWGGVLLASAASFFLVDINTSLLPINIGWRISLVLGPLIGMSIWPLRKYIPESPRWQLGHGQLAEAEATVDQLEAEIRATGVTLAPVDQAHAVVIRKKEEISYLRMLKLLFTKYLRRSVLSAVLMATQSFLYNAIFFTFAIILHDFYGVKDPGIYLIPFAIGNLFGPLILGRFFDTIGRRLMIAVTYCTSAILLAVSGWMFSRGMLDATTQTVLWCVIFFIASSAASSAYLTVSEIFPIEIRGQAIAIFFSIAQLFGGVGPFIFGAIISGAVNEQTHQVMSRGPLAIAYIVSAGIMFAGGLIAWFLGVDAEGKSLEEISPPILSVPAMDAADLAGAPR